jgi:spore germination cell wall hydrolase CwlJ-like protein
MQTINKVLIGAGVAITATFAFQQAEIETVHEEVAEVKSFLIQTSDRVKYTKNDLTCLAENVYYEAGVEPVEGKYAVAQVTLNRLRTKHWGKNICSVVHAKAQFSWTLNKHRAKPEGTHWVESQVIARSVLRDGVRVKPLKHALMYHATWLHTPKWVDLNQRVMRVGDHVFYNNYKGSTLDI